MAFASGLYMFEHKDCCLLLRFVPKFLFRFYKATRGISFSLDTTHEKAGISNI